MARARSARLSGHVGDKEEMTATSFTSTTSAVYNPAITSKQVIDIREANLGWEATVSAKYRDEAGMGTTIKWPVVSALTAATKAEGNDTSLVYSAPTDSSITLTINQWQYSAYELEEFEASLSIIDIDTVYANRASYAVNLAIDSTLKALPSGASQTVGSLGVDLQDDDVRRAIQYLDDANVPQDDRYFAMVPAAKNSMLAIDRYNSTDFIPKGAGGNIAAGTFGNIYGLTTWMTTNITGSNSTGHDCCIYHRDFMALGMRREPHVRTFDAIDHLSEQHAISAIWGVIEVRDDHGVYVKSA